MSPKHHRTSPARLKGAAALLLVPVLAAAQSVPPRTAASFAPPPLSASDAATIAQVLRAAPQQGIYAPNVSADVAQLAGSDPAARAQAGDKLAQAAVAYARAEHGMAL